MRHLLFYTFWGIGHEIHGRERRYDMQQRTQAGVEPKSLWKGLLTLIHGAHAVPGEL